MEGHLNLPLLYRSLWIIIHERSFGHVAPMVKMPNAKGKKRGGGRCGFIEAIIKDSLNQSDIKVDSRCRPTDQTSHQKPLPLYTTQKTNLSIEGIGLENSP